MLWHGFHTFGWGFFPGFGLFHLLFWVLAIGLIVSAVRAARRRADYAPAGARSASLAILEERYAKGEIPREEYLQKRGDLGV